MWLFYVDWMVTENGRPHVAEGSTPLVRVGYDVVLQRTSNGREGEAIRRKARGKGGRRMQSDTPGVYPGVAIQGV